MDSDETELPPLSEGASLPSGCCKVGRLGAGYRLSGLDEELRRRYEREDATLHELRDYINNRVTATTMAAGEVLTEFEPGRVRAALDGETSLPAAERDDIRARAAGVVDIDALQRSYISHETVRKHLNEHLDVSTSRGGFETAAELEEALRSYREQYERGVAGALRRATERELLCGGEYDVYSTRVECTSCGQVYTLEELLHEGGCDCQA